MLLRLAVGCLAFLIAATCHGLEEVDAHCGKAPDKVGCMRQQEAAALATSRGAAIRAGLVLTIQTRAGPIAFTDHPEAGDQTLVHIYRGQFGSSGYQLVERLSWENYDYILISELSGQQTRVADVPYVSKAGKRAVSIRVTEEDDSSEIVVWSITPESITQEVRLSTAGNPFYTFLFWEDELAVRLKHEAFSDRGRCPKSTYMIVYEELRLTGGKWKLSPDLSVTPICE